MRIRNLMTLLCMATALAGQPVDLVSAQTAKIDQRSINFHNDAKKALEKNDLRAAQIQLRNAVRQDPNNLDARYDLGIVNMRLGDLPSAEKDLQQAMQSGFNPDKVMPDYATTLLLQRKFDKVLSELKTSPDLSKQTQARIAALRGAAHLGLGQPAEGERELRESLAIMPTVDAHLALSRVAAAKRDRDEAIAQATKAIEVDPKSADAHVLRGEQRRATNDLAAARADFDKAVELSPRHVGALLSRADLAVAQARFADVEADSDAVLQIAPRNPHAQYYRALVLATKGESQKAADVMQGIQTFTQTYLPALYLSGALNFNLNRPQQAETELTQVIAARPGHVAARRLLATIYLRRNEAEKALQTLTPVREIGANDVQMLSLLGEAYMKLRRFDDATQVLEQAAKIDPNNRSVLANLGASQLQSGDREEGFQHLEQALAKDPNLTGASNLLVFSLIRQRDFAKARQIAEDLRARTKDNPMPEFYLGVLAMAEGKGADAEKSFRRAMEISPTFRLAAAQLANMKIQEGKFDDASQIYEKQLQASPRDSDTMISLADLEIRRNRLDRAQQWLEKAVSVDERAFNPRFILAELLLSRNDLQKAIAAGRDLLNLAPQDPRAIELMGRIHFANKDPANAATMFKRAASLNPSAANVHHRLGQALLASNDEAGARIAFEEAIRAQPDFQPAWTDRIRLEAQKVGGPAALQVAEKLRQQYPDAMPGDLVVGDLQMAFNRLPEARTAYEAALQKGPSSDAVNRLFVIRLRSGEPAEQAVAFVKDWLNRYPQDTGVRFQLSSYYIENGRLAEAITETELLTKREPNNPLMLNNLAWLYAEKKDPRALELAERAHRLASEEPAIMDTYGWILFNGGKREQGIDLLRKAAQGAPREGQIQYHYAAALAEIGQRDEAKQILRDVLGTRRLFVGRDEAVRLLQRLE
ncbi:MAG: PEP-CTERM system TPR-repeat protein PrsT [Alphaproteobacteria bacterium]|nr:PEP-CTERM system TPR-repeat protein PrsT [Alphaproteobacteria bacterium]